MAPDKPRVDIYDVMCFSGIILLLFGVSLWSTPLACVVGGGLLIAGGIWPDVKPLFHRHD